MPLTGLANEAHLRVFTVIHMLCGLFEVFLARSESEYQGNAVARMRLPLQATRSGDPGIRFECPNLSAQAS